MTLDDAVALSLCRNLSRAGLTERLRSGDPILLDTAARRRAQAVEVRARAIRDGIGVLPWNDSRFPSLLLAIPDAPPALWYRGAPEALAGPTVAIVGSRTASAVALEIAGALSADLAARGVVVVSGLARGVDSAAHRGALRAGRTVAVLGSGVDRVYPPEHRPLAARIADSGVVVSEYPPGAAPAAFHFPMRNRLISGLSRAVVVIEASERSGSLITAGCALDQGREVMAVPGNVLSGRSRGAHALIRDGAAIVESADDVLEQLGWAAPACAARPAPGVAPADQDAVLRTMRDGEPCDIDRLAGAAGVDAGGVLARLLALELQGLVERLPDGRFMRLRRPC